MEKRMRRIRQQLKKEVCEEILKKGTSGVLALCGKDGEPYAVPLSYLYLDGKVYFHGAKEGMKLDVLAENNRASFCVIGMDELHPETFTTFFQSVILYGTVNRMTDEAEMRKAVDALAIKYAPEMPGFKRHAEIDREWKALAMLVMNVERMTGKQAIELVKSRGEGE